VTYGIKKSKRVAQSIFTSPIRLVSELISMKLPLEEANSRLALEKGSCVDVQIEKSDYSNNRTLLTYASMAIFNSDYVSLYPIEREGKSFLIAIFPTKHKKKIEPLLDIHAEKISERYKLFFSKMKKLFDLLKKSKSSIDYSDFGSFFGSFTAEILNSLK
jgi:hypothetical protein